MNSEAMSEIEIHYFINRKLKSGVFLVKAKVLYMYAIWMTSHISLEGEGHGSVSSEDIFSINRFKNGQTLTQLCFLNNLTLISTYQISKMFLIDYLRNSENLSS